MRYRVRSPEGELTYETFGEVEKAFLNGLVDLNDELLEEGQTRWRKASSIPVLAQARRSGNQVWAGTQMAWLLILIVFGSVALYLLVNGWIAYDNKVPLMEVAKHYWIPGLVVAIALGSILTTVTYRAFKRTRPQ
jgi:hypothetical protein